MSLNVLVTGAGGYIGSLLCPFLVHQGCRVCALDIAFAPDLPNSVQYEKNITDVREETNLLPFLKKADVIIPLAAWVGAPKCAQNPHDAWDVNFHAIDRLNRLRSVNQLVIFPMTNNGYRLSPECLSADETSPWDEGSVYTQSKKKAEDTLLAKGNAVSLRLASLFGVSPAMRDDLLIHTLLWEALTTKKINLTEGNFRRSFLHAQDAVAAFSFFTQSSQRGIFNLALPAANLTKIQLAEEMLRFVPEARIYSSQISRDPDQRDFFISIEKITRAGFSPRWSLAEGIQEVLQYYKISLPAMSTR